MVVFMMSNGATAPCDLPTVQGNQRFNRISTALFFFSKNLLLVKWLVVVWWHWGWLFWVSGGMSWLAAIETRSKFVFEKNRLWV